MSFFHGFSELRDFLLRPVAEVCGVVKKGLMKCVDAAKPSRVKRDKRDAALGKVVEYLPKRAPVFYIKGDKIWCERKVTYDAGVTMGV